MVTRGEQLQNLVYASVKKSNSFLQNDKDRNLFQFWKNAAIGFSIKIKKSSIEELEDHCIVYQ